MYKGQVDNNGRRHGWGAFILFETGDFYIGGWRNNQKDDFGVLITGSPENHIQNSPNARIYIGNFTNNQKSRQGRLYDNTGNLLFSGHFQNDRPSSVNTSATPTRFQIIDYTDGSFFIGETVNGKREGIGIYLWTDGSIFIGNWLNNNRRGIGAEIVSNGNVFSGTWDNNSVSTRGTNIISPRLIDLPPIVATRSLQVGNIGSHATHGNNNIQQATINATRRFIQRLPRNMSYAITNISSTNANYSEFVFSVLEDILVTNNFVLRDRHAMNEILKEQTRQLSDDFDISTAVRIGRFAGADVVIIGSITGRGDLRAVTLRAINDETTNVVSSASEQFR
jgi:hypothetical protein